MREYFSNMVLGRLKVGAFGQFYHPHLTCLLTRLCHPQVNHRHYSPQAAIILSVSLRPKKKKKSYPFL